MPLAVIDIGSTSVRMIIAQVLYDGTLKTLEFLHQAVTLGRDTFTKGYIAQTSIEECVRAIKSFRRLLDDYNIVEREFIRAVATTAVREAENCDAFIDRISVATGINLEIIDESDIARLTYLSFRTIFSNDHISFHNGVVISEVSGGSSFLLHLENGDVAGTYSHRLGSLRTHEMIESAGTPDLLQAKITKSHVSRTIDRIINSTTIHHMEHLIALGGDIRFAVKQVVPTANLTDVTTISLSRLKKFTDVILGYTVDECMLRYNLSYADAESIGPALLFYVYLAKACGVKKITVAPVSMRHGLLLEMAGRGIWSEHMQKQIIKSALIIGHKYHFDYPHAQQVHILSSIIFKALQKEHQLDTHNELLLTVAAYLHDIGIFINSRSHHKHSMYLIQNSDLFGLNKRQKLLVSLIARYHRRASPKPAHPDFSRLDRQGRLCVAKLAAILRVADALDRTNNQQIRHIECSSSNDQFIITVKSAVDISLEQIALQNKGSLFSEVYGMELVLRHGKAPVE